MARLEEICSLITDGSHFSPEDEGVGYPMFSVKDMTPNGFNISGCKKIGEDAYKKLVANGCKPLNDDVVVAKDGSYLKTAFVIKGNPEITLLSSIAILRPKIDLVVPEYLSYFLKSDAVYRTVSLNYITGTALKRIILKGIRKIEVDLPDIGEQEQRAQRLSKVDYLCQLRKQQLAKLDELVKARFVEMFGDPVSNPLHWKKVKLSELADIKIGPFGSLLHKEDYVTGGHPLVNPSHIINGKIIVDNDLTLTEGKYFELSAYRLKKNDVVLGRRGEMGRCAVVDEEGLLCGTGSLLIRTNGTVTADYIQKIISFPTFKKTIEDMAVGQTMPNLNVPIVSNFMIIIPPLSVQKDYYDFVECVDQQKQTVQQSLEKLELMKKALMQEYFG